MEGGDRALRLDLGIELAGREDVPQSHLNSLLPIDGTKIELIHPIEGEGPVAAYLEKRGGGTTSASRLMTSRVTWRCSRRRGTASSPRRPSPAHMVRGWPSFIRSPVAACSLSWRSIRLDDRAAVGEQTTLAERKWAAAQRLILGFEGTTPSDESKAFVREAAPAGFILFARNIEEPAQVLELNRGSPA